MPVGIHAIDPWSLPLLGTCILLASGFTVTAAHHAIIACNKYSAIINLTFTVILGALFVFLQANEYYYSSFTIADSVFGSAFYMLTGLHGLHIIVGTLFLFVGLYRLIKDSFTSEHHLVIEFSVIYWHFNLNILNPRMPYIKLYAEIILFNSLSLLRSAGK